MLMRLYRLFKKKPRRIELEWYEIDPSVLEQGLVRSFVLPARCRPSSKDKHHHPRRRRNQKSI